MVNIMPRVFPVQMEIRADFVSSYWVMVGMAIVVPACYLSFTSHNTTSLLLRPLHVQFGSIHLSGKANALAAVMSNVLQFDFLQRTEPSHAG